MKHILIIKRLLQSSKSSSVRQYMWNLWVNGFLMSYVVPVGIRRFCLNCMGANVKGSLHGHCTILTNKLKLAENSFINRNCFIDNNADVSIGQNCAVGYNVVFITSNHSIRCNDRRGGKLLPIPIEVHDGCWIGANSTILPGTVIEKGCVIAAGSVVKGLLKSNRLYAGVPAKEIRQLE